MESLYATVPFNHYHIVIVQLQNLFCLLEFELSKPRNQILDDSIHSSINNKSESLQCAVKDFRMITANLLSVACELKF